MTDKGTIMVMAGGTGGHVFPALATAQELIKRGYGVHWLGTRRGIEARLIPDAGIPIDYISVEGVRGKGWKGLLKAPFLILRSIIESMRIQRAVNPLSVLGMGGFASGPGGIAAWCRGVPLVIHEQNAIAGTTNRLLSRFAKRILAAFPGAFTGSRSVEVVGNPIREEIAALSSTAPSDDHDELRILVLGGSLGAQAINDSVPEFVAHLAGQRSVALIHQTGTRHIDAVRESYEKLEAQHGGDALKHCRAVAFIDDMAEAYHWADLVICRSGALTVSELAAAALPAILIPFPHAIDDHQTANARWLADHGAAILLPQNQVNTESLVEAFAELSEEAGGLAQRAAAAAQRSMPGASQKVADICLEVVHEG